MKRKSQKLFIITITLILISTLFFAGCADLARNTTTQVPDASAGIISEEAAEEAEQLCYVSIDINPSIQLTVKDGLVLEVLAFNDDGAQIILACDVIGMTPDAAITAIVNEFAAGGYIAPDDPDASLVITVTGGEDEETLDGLKQNAQQSLEGLGLGCNIVATTVSQQMAETAKNCGLSPGRYILLKQVAEQEKISLQEAKELYGSLKMGELLKMIEDLDALLEQSAMFTSVIESLTPEQLQILTDASAAFKEAMKAVQQAFLQAREEAKLNFQTMRDEIKEAFLAEKDNDALKEAKKELKEAFSLAKKEALEAMKQGKVAAREAFMTTVISLGLDEETISQMLEWSFDDDFDFDLDLDFGGNDEDEDEDGGKPDKEFKNNGKGHDKNKAGDDEDDEDDDEGDGDDGADEDGESEEV